MKVIGVLLAVAAIISAAPPSTNDKDAVVLKYDSDNIGVGGYSYSMETSNGISAEEQGEVINPGSENESIAVRGQFSYTGADGQQYEVTYVADENGFQPQGAHLPHPIHSQSTHQHLPVHHQTHLQTHTQSQPHPHPQQYPLSHHHIQPHPQQYPHPHPETISHPPSHPYHEF